MFINPVAAELNSFKARYHPMLISFCCDLPFSIYSFYLVCWFFIPCPFRLSSFRKKNPAIDLFVPTSFINVKVIIISHVLLLNSSNNMEIIICLLLHRTIQPPEHLHQQSLTNSNPTSRLSSGRAHHSLFWKFPHRPLIIHIQLLLMKTLA